MSRCCPWCNRNVELTKVPFIKSASKVLGNWAFGGKRMVAKDMFTYVSNVKKAISTNDLVVRAIEKEWECPLCKRLIIECGHCSDLHKWDDTNFRVCSCGALC